MGEGADIGVPERVRQHYMASQVFEPLRMFRVNTQINQFKVKMSHASKGLPHF